MATFAASATSRIVGLPAIYAPQPTQWWLIHTKGKGAARTRSLPLWLRDHNNFPKEVPRFHERLRVAKLGERECADFGLLDFAVRHIDHSPPNVLLGVTVRTANLHFALPDIANVGPSVETGRRTAGQQFAVQLQGTDRRVPRVPAGEIDAHVHALLAAQPPCFARKILRAVVDGMVGAQLLELRAFLIGASTGDNSAAVRLHHLHRRGPDAAARAEYKNQVVRLHAAIGEQHAIDRAVVRRNGGGFDIGKAR